MTKKLCFFLFWTLAYVLFSALFFYTLFDFEIWNTRAWDILARSTIRGFKGLTFGISLLSAIPIYIASVRYIWKTNRLPFVPKPEKKPDAQKKSETDEDMRPKYDLPENLPDELREPFIRFHSGQLSRNTITFVRQKNTENLPTGVADTTPPETAPDAFMPVPDSFDSETANTPANNFISAPVFSDMTFGDEEVENSPLKITNADGKKVATYIFDDPDFWVADDVDFWFAEGKQIESPIKLLLNSAADKRRLVLKTNNIMNLETLVPEWEGQNITVEK